MSFSTRRSGSTKLFNLFRASADLIDLKRYELKTHPYSYSINDIDLSGISKKIIVLISQRELISQAYSFDRVINNEGYEGKLSSSYIKSISEVLKERKAELEILKKTMIGKINVFYTNYKYITTKEVAEQLQTCLMFIGKCFDLTISKQQICNLLSGESIVQNLIIKYGLTKESACNIQQRLNNDFSLRDNYTQLHGNHIDLIKDSEKNRLNNIYKQNYFDIYSREIDKRYNQFTLDLLRGRLDDLSISNLETRLL